MARSRRKGSQASKTPPARLILDSGAVIAWSRGAAGVRALLARAVELGMDVRVPVAVLAEVLRGGPRDAPVHRVLRAVTVSPTEERVGRLAGTLLGRTGGSNALGALVAAEALTAQADLVTSDVDDLAKLLTTHPEVTIISTAG